MKILIVGYGKMGQQIEQLLLADPEYEVAGVACRQIGDDLTVEQLQAIDVAIDFSNGELMRRHIDLYCQAGVSAVIGTTGWEIDSPEVRQQIDNAGIGVVVGSNFSAGVQVFLRLLRQAARQLDAVGGYDVYGLEMHHRNKEDSPSGTAKTISTMILNNFSSKTTTNYDRIDGRIGEDVLHFASIRGGENRGHHQIIFDSLADEISLTHTAHSRIGFAAGAISAARWLQYRQGYFKYEEMFNQEEE